MRQSSFARSPVSLLENNHVFPDLEIAAVGGGTIRLPRDLAGAFGVVAIYRGHWCPFCNDQLASLQAESAKFAELGVKVVAFSVDDEPTTAALAAKLHLGFPLGHSASVAPVVAATGAFVGEHGGRPILQPTAFLLAPDGKILMETYASGPVGRMTGQDIARVVAYIKSISKS
jgi:peroxiredoxin